jgi:formimidoylglutamate deiminase
MVVLDPEHPALVGRDGDALLDSWIFSGTRSPVRHVLVGGRVVVRDGHHPAEEMVAARYRQVLRKIRS